MRGSVRSGKGSRFVQDIYNWGTHHAQQILTRLKSQPESADYLTWRHQFLRKRLRLALFIGLFWYSVISAHNIYSILVDFEELESRLLDVYGDAAIAAQLRSAIITSTIVSITLLIMCLIGHRTRWGRRYPGALFLLSAWSINQFVEQIIATFSRIPISPETDVFLALALLIPVHWRLHLISQALPIAYYAIVYPVIGLTTLGTTDTYNLYSVGTIIQIGWVCSVSNLAVYLYERLKRSEFETNRQLQMFLHSVSHDLRTPVIGSSLVLKSLLEQSTNDPDLSNDFITVKRSALAHLLQGSDRQLTLIESLLEAHTTELQGITIHPEPIQLKPVVDSVLLDLQHLLTKKHIRLNHHITDDLPLVQADPNQLWRVLSNLMGNALKHNPHNIGLTLEARVIEPKQRHRRERGINRMDTRKPLMMQHVQPQPQVPMLLCMVQDTGIGIAPQQRHRLFELYARGAQARYMPGLGLGLYLCKQIIEAHGGEIGAISQMGEGATFWFTLPLHPT